MKDLESWQENRLEKLKYPINSLKFKSNYRITCHKESKMIISSSLVIPNRFVLLRSKDTKECFITSDHQNITKLQDGTVAYEILDYAFSIEEAQKKLKRIFPPSLLYLTQMNVIFSNFFNTIKGKS